MNFIDTHTHLYDESLQPDLTEAINRCLNLGVREMYMPNCDSSTIEPMLQVEAQFPENCFSMIGLHPCYVKENVMEELAIVEQWLTKRKFAAVGEIGIDKYWDVQFLEQQKMAFSKQIELADKHKLPIVIHSREATQDCIDILKQKQQGQLKGVFHCFSGTIEEANQIKSLGFYLGIGGVVTFKKTNLPEIINEVGLGSIVLETDAPYLAPMPYRGKRNESSYIPLIAQKIADILTLNIEVVANETTLNAKKIFS